MSELEKIILTDRSYLSQKRKGQMYARAIDKFEEHYANKDFLSAFVICLSLLEDIIASTYLNIKLINKEITPRQRRERVDYIYDDYGRRKYLTTKNMLYEMKKEILFNNDKLRPRSELKKIISIFTKRNKIIHESMWNINALNSKHCDDAYDQFNIIKQYHYISERGMKNRGIRFRSNG